ncbi:RBBP9/YdeN family alpha/beta hydrolase [Leeia oryzae]|uniref:RBBP9/YdeN family alpha/beta hydrolase n=1 Tax=Leeia oryzae TaxID=356662 RepID=UPI001FE05422|nr:alpha/beta hydrolase [Leeia oryzae]
MIIVPGYLNSDPDHWQTRWEKLYAGTRVKQHDWEFPVMTQWVQGLDDAIRQINDRVVLVAHSLGCSTIAFWARSVSAETLAKVDGALLVAPPDTEAPDFIPAIQGYAPLPQTRLPFQSILVASSDDPYCKLERAEQMANHWGSTFKKLGPYGHINTASGLGEWPEGQRWLADITHS